MTEHEITQILKAMDAKLSALVAIHTQRLLVEDSDLAKPRPRSVDKLLHDAGLNQQEIADVLGKTRQAVGQVLKKG